MTLKVVPLVEFATPMMEPTGRETGTPTPGTPGTPDTVVTLAVTATGCASCSLVSAAASSVSLVNGSDMSGSTATLSDVWLSSISAVLASSRLASRQATRARSVLSPRLFHLLLLRRVPNSSFQHTQRARESRRGSAYVCARNARRRSAGRHRASVSFGMVDEPRNAHCSVSFAHG
ncbi:hypothetical protein DBV15_03905 [Temnothorax longispinosus]|uniref:Uncharacterized protein n=1 Tax=Temnothorax longispinosus TaxID=300112 RepID=A0A4S2KU69_9HYME|nr:hypothetical protein DBV15_03905 [Temnothorax longispinosus]